jgi:hypothetical protein
MCPSVLSAIRNIHGYRNTDLKSYSSRYLIRINAVGEQLEYYLKDSLSGSFTMELPKKEQLHHETFSWLGNQNNPPDLILKDGDAFEIKKCSGAIQLNSSPPKDRLYSSDPRLLAETAACDGGKWESKDLFYMVGDTEGARLISLFIVQGLCYAAHKEIYQRVADKISGGVAGAIASFSLEGGTETNELGRVNRVDPLGITYLRVRGMWVIEGPNKVFSYIYAPNQSDAFNLAALLTEEKYASCPSEDRKALEGARGIYNRAVKIRDPNNPANRIDARLISFGW